MRLNLMAPALALVLCGSSPAFGKPATAPPPVVATARQIIADLAARRPAEVVKRFDSTMTALLPAPKLGQTWDALVAKVGAFKAAGRAVVQRAVGHDLVVVRCRFEKDTLEVKVAFNAAGRVAGLIFSPPWAAPPYAKGEFEEKDVKVGTAAYPLDGKLCLPKGTGPFPAVVLVHGSGPHDLDESIGPNKPFKDLAWGLAARRVAVLRYEKRTWRYGRTPITFTVKDEAIDDARSAVALLAKTTGVDRKRIFVLGHSLGGWVAPRIALADRLVAGIVVLAGPTRPFEDVLLAQLKLIAPAKVKQGEATAKQLRDPKLAPRAEVIVLGVKTHGAYWIDYRAHPPTRVAPRLRVPILVLQGERDYQVIRADFEGWRKALRGRPRVKLKLYPALNHLFMSGSGVSTPAEYAKPGHVDVEVIRDIGAFVGGQAL